MQKVLSKIKENWIGIALAIPLGFTIYMAGKGEPAKDIPKFLDKTCIEGHLYYEPHTGHEGIPPWIAPVLADDGKPIKCEWKENVTQ